MAPALIRIAVLVSVIRGEGDPTISDVDVQGWLEEAASYVIGAELLPRSESLAVDREVRRCGPDITCIADRLSAAGASHGLLLIVDGTSAVMSGQIVDAHLRRVTASTFEPIPEGATRERARSQAFALFTEAGCTVGGRLYFRGSPADTRVAIRSANGALSELLLPALVESGHHDLVLSHEGYDPTEREMTIVQGRDVTLEDTLSESEGLIHSPWLWVAVGTAAAAIGVGTYFLARPRQATLCLAAEPVDCGE